MQITMYGKRGFIKDIPQEQAASSWSFGPYHLYQELNWMCNDVM
jgi:hypothetical protein